MVLSEYYDRMQEGIFTENLSGTYIKRRPSRCSNAILALGIVNFALFLSSIYTYLSVMTTNIPYSANTRNSVFLPKGINYMYIDLTGVYQNYMNYAKSISHRQLQGQTTNLNLSTTEPFDYNGDKPYYPAGAIAATYFQDKIDIDGLDIETEDISRGVNRDHIGMTSYQPDEISIPENWTARTNEDTEPLNTFAGSGLPILNERFINWMQQAPFSSFKKLWGKINVERAGYYNVTIESTYDIARRKRVLFTERSILGIPNYYASACFFGVGVLSVLTYMYLGKYGY